MEKAGKLRISHFFQHIEETDYLSWVRAVAMDMNASYNRLVEEHLPKVQIVYDRYRFQSQFGRDCLDRFALLKRENTRKLPKNLRSRRLQKQRFKRKKIPHARKARWTLLSNAENPSDRKKASLNEILKSHSDLSVCYTVKEELTELYLITDPAAEELRWRKRFDAAEHSDIPALVRFARLKRKRLSGLIAHASFRINTGKLYGFNNKIKVAKRNSYSFRNNLYFFSFIRFLTLPVPSSYTKL